MRFLSGHSVRRHRFATFFCEECKTEVDTEKQSGKRALSCKKCRDIGIGLKISTHGKSNTDLYKVYVSMNQRCNNIKAKAYKHYGLKGVSVSSEFDTFEKFENWSIENDYSKGLSIDRINPNGNYEPANCRWTNKTVQARNTRVLREDNKTGFRCVNLENSGNYSARITISGKSLHIGTYKTAKLAAIAYNYYVENNNLEHTKNVII